MPSSRATRHQGRATCLATTASEMKPPKSRPKLWAQENMETAEADETCGPSRVCAMDPNSVVSKTAPLCNAKMANQRSQPSSRLTMPRGPLVHGEASPPPRLRLLQLPSGSSGAKEDSSSAGGARPSSERPGSSSHRGTKTSVTRRALSAARSGCEAVPSSSEAATVARISPNVTSVNCRMCRLCPRSRAFSGAALGERTRTSGEGSKPSTTTPVPRTQRKPRRLGSESAVCRMLVKTVVMTPAATPVQALAMPMAAPRSSPPKFFASAEKTETTVQAAPSVPSADSIASQTMTLGTFQSRVAMAPKRSQEAAWRALPKMMTALRPTRSTTRPHVKFTRFTANWAVPMVEIWPWLSANLCCNATE
mmetsp:Transcript_18246/g.57410  ORF Transcript_18246/g.57410 Transcript_18246/m.57410 type:complete len:365 (-) Transcript_18246:132-1226(-)